MSRDANGVYDFYVNGERRRSVSPPGAFRRPPPRVRVIRWGEGHRRRLAKAARTASTKPFRFDAIDLSQLPDFERNKAFFAQSKALGLTFATGEAGD